MQGVKIMPDGTVLVEESAWRNQLCEWRGYAEVGELILDIKQMWKTLHKKMMTWREEFIDYLIEEGVLPDDYDEDTLEWVRNEFLDNIRTQLDWDGMDLLEDERIKVFPKIEWNKCHERTDKEQKEYIELNREFCTRMWDVLT